MRRRHVQPRGESCESSAGLLHLSDGPRRDQLRAQHATQIHEAGQKVFYPLGFRDFVKINSYDYPLLTTKPLHVRIVKSIRENIGFPGHSLCRAQPSERHTRHLGGRQSDGVQVLGIEIVHIGLSDAPRHHRGFAGGRLHNTDDGSTAFFFTPVRCEFDTTAYMGS